MTIRQEEGRVHGSEGGSGDGKGNGSGTAALSAAEKITYKFWEMLLFGGFASADA